MKSLTRIAVATAATLTLALAPVGMASAQSTASAPQDRRDDASITLPADQLPGVLQARAAYLTQASAARTTYHDAVEGILDEARKTTAPAQLAYEIAKDAYAVTRATGGDATAAKAELDTRAAAYKAALESARTVARPKLDAAKTTARTALDKAVSDYVLAVKAAAPNAPQALLVPPGRGKSWISHGFGKDYGMGWGSMGRR
jgi:hypothetical protein